MQHPNIAVRSSIEGRDSNSLLKPVLLSRVHLNLTPQNQQDSNLIRLTLLMQQVIRSIQNKRHRELERKKIKQLTPQQFFNNIRYYSKNSTHPHQILRHQYQHLQNMSYNRLERLSEQKMYPLSYVFAYEPLLANQIKEEQKRSRSISQRNEFLLHYKPINQRASKQRKDKEQAKKQDSEHILVKNKLIIHSKAKRKLKAIFLAVFACIIIKSHFQEYLGTKREKSLKNSKICVQQAVLSFQEYFFKLLQQEITQYILLLEKTYRYLQYNPNKDIMRILVFITTKLSNSSIPIPIIAALQTTVTKHCFYQFPFLFYSVFERLMFTEEWGCSVDVDSDQSCMITASFLGIALLCYNLLYRPWLAQDLFLKKEKRQFKIQSKYNKLRNILNGVGSIIYFLILDNFILNIPIVPRKEKDNQRLFNLQMKIAPNLNVMVETEEEQSQPSEKSEDSQSQQKSLKKQKRLQNNLKEDEKDEINIILGQDRKYFIQLKDFYDSQMQIIQQNLKEWIIKATVMALKKSSIDDKNRKLNYYKFKPK